MATSVGMGHNLGEWLQPLIEAGVIPSATRRIIIDIKHDDIVLVYYECEADNRMFTVDLTKALSGAEVVGVADMPEKT